MKSKGQISFFDDEVDIQANIRGVGNWPEKERFPYNFNKTRVEDIVLKDLSASQSPLIITGFTSLDYIIDFVAALFTFTASDATGVVIQDATAVRVTAEMLVRGSVSGFPYCSADTCGAQPTKKLSACDGHTNYLNFLLAG